MKMFISYIIRGSVDKFFRATGYNKVYLDCVEIFSKHGKGILDKS
jgi:hypothetical protein